MLRLMKSIAAVNATPAYGWRDRAAPGSLSGDCVRAGERCVAACDIAFCCGFELIQSGHPQFARAVRLCQDCAALCEAAVSLAGRDSELAAAACEAAAEACYACAAAAEAFPDVADMKACATACRDYAAACRDLTEAARLSG